MISQKKKKKKKDNKTSVVFITIFLAVFFIFFVYLNVNIYSKRNNMEGEIEYLIGEIQKLEEIKNNLEDVGQNAEDEEFLERVGRENFNLKKEGETTVAFPMIEEVIAATSSEIEVQVEEEKGSFWQRLENKLRK